MSECYVGSIVLWAGNFVPRNWMLCNGQTVSINDYQILYAVIGDTYGGNGTSTFDLPNLIGKVPLGASNVNPLGSNGGGATATATGITTLTANNLPAHDHPGSNFALTELSAITTVNLSTNVTDGQVVPTAGAMLAGTSQGETAAAIYLPASTAQLAPVHLGGVQTTVDATVTPVVNPAVTGNGNEVTPLTFIGQAPATPPGVTLNYLICVTGLYPSRN
jgi:microcystin-dependent protein